MKTLQNNFTTPEQSKRLLELGVPADSADMFYYTAVAEYPRISAHAYGHIPNEHSIPCWSGGRLIEIINICSTTPFPNETTITRGDVDLSIVKTLIARFEELVNYYSLDFSKLEE